MVWKRTTQAAFSGRKTLAPYLFAYRIAGKTWTQWTQADMVSARAGGMAFFPPLGQLAYVIGPAATDIPEHGEAWSSPCRRPGDRQAAWLVRWWSAEKAVEARLAIPLP